MHITSSLYLSLSRVYNSYYFKIHGLTRSCDALLTCSQALCITARLYLARGLSLMIVLTIRAARQSCRTIRVVASRTLTKSMDGSCSSIDGKLQLIGRDCGRSTRMSRRRIFRERTNRQHVLAARYRERSFGDPGHEPVVFAIGRDLTFPRFRLTHTICITHTYAKHTRRKRRASTTIVS